MKISVSLHGVFRIDRFKEEIRDYPEDTKVQDVVDDLGISEMLLGIVVINDRHGGWMMFLRMAIY
jgi:hypothetical protein